MTSAVPGEMTCPAFPWVGTPSVGTLQKESEPGPRSAPQAGGSRTREPSSLTGLEGLAPTPASWPKGT